VSAPLLIDGGGQVTEPYAPNQAFQGMCPNSQNPGIDIAAPCGRIMRAVGYGYVVSVGKPCWAGPHAVVIGSGNVWILYAHASNHFVSPGGLVSPGTAVAAVGSMTGGACCGASQANPCAASNNCGGVATGPHVHFQVNPAGLAFDTHYCSGINPVPYLSSWPGAAPSPAAAIVAPAPAPAVVAKPSSMAPLLFIAGGIALVAARR
jgi:murein DD-endopeptidase MepM/ murein hydrolase activator NlpD